MEITPEVIKAAGEAAMGLIAAVAAGVSGIASIVVGFYTWKTRYELDRLYAAKYRPNPDGTPGPMRKHPPALVSMFKRKPKAKTEKGET